MIMKRRNKTREGRGAVGLYMQLVRGNFLPYHTLAHSLTLCSSLFITCPRQAKAWLLGVSEKTELMLRVSGGSDESCCAHWLLVFWAPTVEKDNEGRRWRITLRVIIPQGNLQQWGPYPMDSAATIPCNFSMRSLAHKAKAILRPFMVLRVSPEMPWGLLPWGPWQNTPSIPFRTKAAPGNLEIWFRGRSRERGRKTCSCTLKDAPWFLHILFKSLTALVRYTKLHIFKDIKDKDIRLCTVWCVLKYKWMSYLYDSYSVYLPIHPFIHLYIYIHPFYLPINLFIYYLSIIYICMYKSIHQSILSIHLSLHRYPSIFMYVCIYLSNTTGLFCLHMSSVWSQIYTFI